MITKCFRVRILKLEESYQNLQEFYDLLPTLDCTDVDRALITLLRYGVPIGKIGTIKWENIDKENNILNVHAKNSIIKLPIDNNFITIIDNAKECTSRIVNTKEYEYIDCYYIIKTINTSKWVNIKPGDAYNKIGRISSKSNVERISVPDLKNDRKYDLLFKKQKEYGTVTNDHVEEVLKLIEGSSTYMKTRDLKEKFESISDIEVLRRKRGANVSTKLSKRTISEHQLGTDEAETFNSEDIKDIEDDFNNIELESNNIEEKYRNDFIKARIGQGKFRDALIKKHGCKCDVCGLAIKELLIASHIKEYVYCENNEHIDLENGLLLCPNHDKLFDRHLISFNSDGRMMFSESINTNNYEQLNIKKDTTIDKYLFKEEYMSYHREKIV